MQVVIQLSRQFGNEDNALKSKKAICAAINKQSSKWTVNATISE